MLKHCLPALLMFMALTQAPPKEDYPGQSQHAMPPPGWYCSANAKVEAHKCTCKRMAHSTPEDPVCEEQVPESSQCKVYCHASRCLCPVDCSIPEHHHGAH